MELAPLRCFGCVLIFNGRGRSQACEHALEKYYEQVEAPTRCFGRAS